MSVPALFDYHTATTVNEAIALLQQYGDEAKILAGGHSLIPAMKLRLLEPEHLIDISRAGLSYVHQEEDGTVVVGAMTTYTTLARSDLLPRHFPLLSDTVEVIGDQMVRNLGTIGGSIAHADPATDMPTAVLALKADITVQGPHGKRTIQADDFFVGAFETALNQHELVTEIRFALPPAHARGAYSKLESATSRYAIAGCAAVLSLDGSGACRAASLAIGGAGTRTARACAGEAALVGKMLNAPTVAEAATHAVEGIEFLSDIHGSARYRRQMAIVVTRKTIMRALS